MKFEKWSRRKFVSTAAAAGAGLVILKDSRSARGAPLNSQLNVALIGCSGQGGSYAAEKGEWNSVLTHGHRLVALCDVNEARAAGAFKRYPDALKGNDYRRMFDKYSDKIDAVVVSTGDYSHAPASAAAIRAGKPVYCEKPLTVTVKEARMLGRLAAEHKVVTQMGNQCGYDRKAVNLVWSGMLGEVREAHGWCSGAGVGRRPLPAGKKDIPTGLHWDLWLGPAPYREYHPEWMQWLMWREFGTEMLGNRASHSMATLFKALKIGELWKTPPAGAPHPVIRVTCEQCSELCPDTFPKWYKVVWDVPPREGMCAVKVHWYGGEVESERKKLEEIIGHKLQFGASGETWEHWLNSFIVGEKGVAHCGGYAALVEVTPKEKFEGQEPPDMFPKTAGGAGQGGWYNAILKGDTVPMSSFDGFSGPYTEFLHLAHVATLFPEETLEFDPVACSITNNKLADTALSRQYRPGWDMEPAT